jgi:CubicO group peptidase (beta-lactamase class C family)
MGNIDVEVDPAEVGFDIDRLARIDRHFSAYVDDGRLPGWLAVVARAGKVVHVASYGQRDMEADRPVERDTIFRIYSMSKPITSVAAMMLYEEGGFELKDPVSRFIPSFADTQVYRSGSSAKPVLEPTVEPIRMWHLLSHTSGLSYGFHYAHPVDAIYRAAGFEWGAPANADLAECCERFAALPLVFQPGTGWNYGVSTDVLGRVVEIISGQPLDEFFAERIFQPLGMTDTGFFVPADEVDRLAALYVPEPGSLAAVRLPGPDPVKRPTFLSGGGGLVSTAADYHRFTQMLLGGGAVDGVRLLGPRTVRYMTRNHLPGGVDLEAFGQSTFAETSFDGVGFGLGFSVMQDPVANRVLTTPGEFGWGGAASTAFWVDPREQITVLFLTQLLPSSTHPIRPQLKQLVYQALVDDTP